AAEEHKAATAARLSALEEALLRLDAARDEASEKRAQAKAALAQLETPAELTARLDMAHAAAAHDRAAVAEASAELQTHLRDAESCLAGADRAARDALAAMSAAREEKARSEARVEAARARRGEIAHMIATELDCTEAELFALARIAPGDSLPAAEEVEKRLDE